MSADLSATQKFQPSLVDHSLQIDIEYMIVGKGSKCGWVDDPYYIIGYISVKEEASGLQSACQTVSSI